MTESRVELGGGVAYVRRRGLGWTGPWLYYVEFPTRTGEDALHLTQPADIAKAKEAFRKQEEGEQCG